MTFSKTVHDFIRELRAFEHTLSCTDRVWNLIFPGADGRWNHLLITQVKSAFFINHVDGDFCSLELGEDGAVREQQSFGPGQRRGAGDPERVWTPLVASAGRWLEIVRKDWITANRLVVNRYPLDRKRGIVPNSLVRASLNDIYRVDYELGRVACNRFIGIVESGYFFHREKTVVEHMTAGRFFEYCTIAYRACKTRGVRIDPRDPGKELYKRFADGRHEGLLDIDPGSPHEFASWLDGKHPKKTPGGHPWEILRGGNTTHIDLSVYRPVHGGKGFIVEVRGDAITRLAESVRIFLAIHKAKLPISIADPEAIRKRLLALDNIGIVPSYDTLHRANQTFPKDRDVYDVMYYNDLGRQKRRLAPFITWEPLPILKPMER